MSYNYPFNKKDNQQFFWRLHECFGSLALRNANTYYNGEIKMEKRDTIPCMTKIWDMFDVTLMARIIWIFMGGFTSGFMGSDAKKWMFSLKCSL